MHATVFLLSLTGFVLLLFAMPRHQREWLECRLAPPIGRGLRLSGFALVTFAFVVAGTAFGWDYGALVWFGWLTVAAAVTVTANVNRARILRLIGKRKP